jgi:hypothetical protein
VESARASASLKVRVSPLESPRAMELELVWRSARAMDSGWGSA